VNKFNSFSGQVKHKSLLLHTKNFILLKT